MQGGVSHSECVHVSNQKYDLNVPKGVAMNIKPRLKRFTAGLLSTALTLGLVPAAKADSAGQAPSQTRPNFLVILADDLGFSDLGAFGSEIQTPHLDRLALEGVRLTGFHTSSMCAPTRAQLLTGVDSHRSGLGRMGDEPKQRYKGIPGYEGALRDDVATLPEILRDHGYRTVQAGKWHLGSDIAKDPSRKGFEYSFVMLHGGHHHYGADQSFDVAKGGTTFRQNGKTLKKLPADFYSSDTFTTKLIEGLQSTEQKQPGKPFFAYLAFTAPHWPLHAPQENIAKYRGLYNDGYEALRERRIQSQARLGVASATQPRVYSPEVRPWAELNEDEKRYYIAAQEAYAGMVDRLDYNVGRVVDYLKSTGQYENTVILFLSDNGAAGRDLRRDKKPMAEFTKADNRPENIGKPGSFASIGSGWAEASSSPARLYKRYQTEGGTRVAAFLRFGGLPKTGGAIKGVIDNVYANVRDVAPTFLDLAGVPIPKDVYRNRKIQPIIGRSQVAYWKGEADRIYPADVPVGGELYGSKSLRRGDWKLVSLRGSDWALYNIAQDPGETIDLSATHPEKLAQLKNDWDTYARENWVREDASVNAEELGNTNPQ